MPLAGGTLSLPNGPHGVAAVGAAAVALGLAVPQPRCGGFARGQGPAEQKEAGVAAQASGNSQHSQTRVRLSPVTVLHVLGLARLWECSAIPGWWVRTVTGFSRLVLGRSPLPVTQTESSAHPGTRR